MADSSFDVVSKVDRQEVDNALNQAAHDTLRETWMSLHDDRSVRAIVITGAGERAFCTGMDLQDHAARGGPRPSGPVPTRSWGTAGRACPRSAARSRPGRARRGGPGRR